MRKLLAFWLIAVFVTVLSLVVYAQSSAEPADYSNAPVEGSNLGAEGTALVALFQDQAPWGSNQNQSILTARNIGFQVVPSSQMDTIDLSQFPKIVIVSQQPDQFWTRLEANRDRFEEYARNGGVLEMHLANFEGSAVEKVTLPFGLQVTPTFCSNQVAIEDDTDVLVTHPNAIPSTELQNWNCSSHGAIMGIENLIGPSVTVTNAQGPEGPATIGAYAAKGDEGPVGDVVVTYQPVEFMGASTRRFNENLLCFRLEGKGTCPTRE